MNRAIIKGRLGNDPKLKTVGNDLQIVNFSVATNDGAKDKPKTNWHNCTAFKNTAEVINKYFKKGDEILIEGKIDYSKDDDKYYTNINVFSFEFCGSKTESVSAEVVNQEGDDDLPF